MLLSFKTIRYVEDDVSEKKNTKEEKRSNERNIRNVPMNTNGRTSLNGNQLNFFLQMIKFHVKQKSVKENSMQMSLLPDNLRKSGKNNNKEKKRSQEQSVLKKKWKPKKYRKEK